VEAKERINPPKKNRGKGRGVKKVNSNPVKWELLVVAFHPGEYLSNLQKGLCSNSPAEFERSRSRKVGKGKLKKGNKGGGEGEDKKILNERSQKG